MSETAFLTHQQETELALLSHLRRNLAAAPMLTLTPKHFSMPERWHLFRIFQELAAENVGYEKQAIRSRALQLDLPLEATWWNTLEHAAGPEAGNLATIDFFARQLADQAVRQDYANWFDRQRERVVDLTRPVAEVLQDHAQHLALVQDALTQELDPSAESIIDRVLTGNPNPYFPSGIAPLDANVRGLRKGHLWVISAPYKSRKTSTVLNIVEAQLRAGRSVMYIALEDDDQAFLLKLAAIWGDIPEEEVERHTAQGGTPTARVQQVLAEIKETNLRIYDARKGVHNWRNLSNLIAGDKLRFRETDVVVIDYVQAYSGKVEDMQSIVPYVLQVTSEQQVCTIALSQMSNNDIRQGGGNAGMLSTKLSGDWGAACHVGIELHRDFEVPDILELVVKVVRHGRPEDLWVTYNPDSGRFLRVETTPMRIVTDIPSVTERREAQKLVSMSAQTS